MHTDKNKSLLSCQKGTLDFNSDDISYRPLFRTNGEVERESKSQEVTEKVEARAESTSPTPIGESLRMVTKQLLQSPEATGRLAIPMFILNSFLQLFLILMLCFVT